MLDWEILFNVPARFYKHAPLTFAIIQLLSRERDFFKFFWIRGNYKIRKNVAEYFLCQ